MHPYSTDSDERKWIPLLLIFISIGFALILRKYWEGIHFDGTLGELYYLIGLFIDFSVLLFYPVLFHIFNKWVWKWKHFPFVEVPNLNGKWEGVLESSYKEDETDPPNIINPIMEINQTWLEIEIRLYGKDSDSKTYTAAFSTKNQDAIELYYQYTTDPKFGAKETMHMTKGTGWFTLDSKWESFKGGYYTGGRDSKNHGTFEFKKKE